MKKYLLRHHLSPNEVTQWSHIKYNDYWGPVSTWPENSTSGAQLVARAPSSGWSSRESRWFTSLWQEKVSLMLDISMYITGSLGSGAVYHHLYVQIKLSIFVEPKQCYLDCVAALSCTCPSSSKCLWAHNSVRCCHHVGFKNKIYHNDFNTTPYKWHMSRTTVFMHFFNISVFHIHNKYIKLFLLMIQP